MKNKKQWFPLRNHCFSVIKVEKMTEILYNIDNYIYKVEIQ